MVDPFVAISRFLFDQALRLDPGRGEPRNPDWPAGTRLDALVRAVGDPARALLQIGDQLIDARLPSQPKLGERLALRVVEPFPRLVFALENTDEASVASDRTRVQLSAAGRILGEVVGRQASVSGEPSLRLAQSLPLPEPAPGQLHGEDIAQHLRQSLEKSGLFYEKHQARWVAGEYPLAELKQEPQAQRALQQPLPAAPAPHQSPQVAGEAPVLRPDAQAASPAADAEVAAPRLGGEARPAADAPLRGQLELLDGRALTVSVPAWEGRDMRWELPEREPQTDADAPPAWSTRLAVELPALGAVQAQLRISGNGLALAVTSASPESSRRLAAAQLDLMQALRDAGLSLTQLTITAEHG